MTTRTVRDRSLEYATGMTPLTGHRQVSTVEWKPGAEVIKILLCTGLGTCGAGDCDEQEPGQ